MAKNLDIKRKTLTFTVESFMLFLFRKNHKRKVGQGSFYIRIFTRVMVLKIWKKIKF